MNKDLTVGNPQRVLWAFCLPLFASIIFQQLYNIADSLVAGRFLGENALAAVGNSYEISLVFLAVAFGCNIGCSVVASRYFGSKEYATLKTAIYTAMIASALTCLTLMALGLIFCDDLLRLINTPAVVFADSKLYLDIYIWSLPFIFFYNLATGVFSALGDSKTPFWFLAASSVSNIILDVHFVDNVHLGVAGLAWATLLCQGLSCLFSLWIVTRRLRRLPHQTKPALFSLPLLHQFAYVAIPSILQQSFISVGNIVIQGIINSFGAGVMAGYSAAVKLNNMVITSFTTLGSGMSNYSSQNLGAGQLTRIKSGFKAALVIVAWLAVPISLLYWLAPRALLGFFLDSPSDEALASGLSFLRILAPFYIVVASKLATDGILRGTSMMQQFMVATFTDLALRVGLAYVLSRTALGYIGIWCAWPVGWIVGTALSIWYFRRGKWKEA